MVVLPVPGGPHKMMECGRPAATMRPKGPSGGPSKWSWPTTSARALGRKRSARGPWNIRRGQTAETFKKDRACDSFSSPRKFPQSARGFRYIVCRPRKTGNLAQTTGLKERTHARLLSVACLALLLYCWTVPAAAQMLVGAARIPASDARDFPVWRDPGRFSAPAWRWFQAAGARSAIIILAS